MQRKDELAGALPLTVLMFLGLVCRISSQAQAHADNQKKEEAFPHVQFLDQYQGQ